MSDHQRRLSPTENAPPESVAEPDVVIGQSSNRAEGRACDWCRRRKLRCDGPVREDRVCSRCAIASRECGYTDQIKRPGPPSKRYINMLKVRLAKVEGLLSGHFPDVDLMRELANIPMAPLDRVRSRHTTSDTQSSDESDDSSIIVTKLTDKTKPTGMSSNGYVGASSTLPLIQTMSKKLADVGTQPFFFRRPEFWRRPEYEERHLDADYTGVQLRLPPRELLDQHIDAYFTHVNVFYPMLHRSLFELKLATVADDPQFGAVVLLVCACTARSVNYPAATRDEVPGWTYYEQCQPFFRIPTPQEPRLYDLQILVLAQLYLATTSQSMTMGWMLLGMSVRMAQQVGAHRRRAYHSSSNLVDELWKRAFWCILNMDRAMSSGLGLPSALPTESFDLDLPLELDDHCWDLTNEQANYPLKRPQSPLTPSYLSYLVCTSKLHLIHGMVLRTLYSNNKTRLIMGFVGPEWEREVLNRLDSSLSAWTASLPEHLRWDPNQLDGRWFNQSIFLCTTYYHIQILVHNPFMQWSSRSNLASHSVGSGPSFARSLIICTNSALACTDILATQLRRATERPDIIFAPIELPGAFISAVFLLAVLFGQKSHTGVRAIVRVEPERVMTAVQASLDTIEVISRWWNYGTPMWHNLHNLATGHDIPPLPPSTAPPPHRSSRPTEQSFWTNDSELPPNFQLSPTAPLELQPKIVDIVPLATATLAQIPSLAQGDIPPITSVPNLPQEYLAVLPENLKTLLASNLSDPDVTAFLPDGPFHQFSNESGSLPEDSCFPYQ